MRPRLFVASATDFSTQGRGAVDCTRCVVEQEINGIFELECDVPVDGYLYNELALSKILVAPAEKNGTPQAFRIYRISKPINGIATVNAEHISYQLSYIPVMPFVATSLSDALSKITTYAAESCPFTFATSRTVNTAWSSPEVPTSARSILMGADGSLLEQYKGEYEFNNWTVTLKNNIGTDNRVRIAYGKNLMDMLQEESIENTYTGICPYYQSDDYVVTLTEKVLHSANASNFPFQRTIPVDFSDKFEDAPTEQQLRDAGNAYISANNIGVPKVNLEVSFIQLSDTQEYRDKMIESVSLGDTVHVYFETLGIDASAEVVRTVYNVLAERFDTITVGSTPSTFSGVVADQQQEIDQAINKTRKKIRVYDDNGALLLGINPDTDNVTLNGQLSLGSGASISGASNVTITTGGDMTVSHGVANRRAGLTATRTDTGASISMIVGTGGTNHGLYSDSMAKWLIQADGTDVFANLSVNDLLSSSVTTGNATLTGAQKYRFLLVSGIVESGKATLSTLVPVSVLTSTNQAFEIADETNNYVFNLKTSGTNNATITYKSRSSSGQINHVYGVA